MEFRQYFEKDFGKIVKNSRPFKKLSELYSDEALPSIDFQVGESRMEEIFGEAMGLAFEYCGVPAYN